LVGKTDDELRELIDTALAKRLPYYRKARYEISGNELEDRGQIKRTVESFKKLLGI
jgi:shikimate kinase